MADFLSVAVGNREIFDVNSAKRRALARWRGIGEATTESCDPPDPAVFAVTIHFEGEVVIVIASDIGLVLILWFISICVPADTDLWSLADDSQLGAAARSFISFASRYELMISDIVL